MFRAVLGVALGLVSSSVDDANRAIALELGATEMVHWETGEIVECDDVPLEEQEAECVERMRWALLTISNRENPGNWSPDRRYTGIHERDSRHESNVFRWAKKFDRLSGWCPSHWTAGGMSTVGPHGLMYGYNVQRLGAPGNCVPVWAFGLPTVSARAAALRYLELCDAHLDEPGGWCPTTDQVVRTMKRARRRARIRS